MVGVAGFEPATPLVPKNGRYMIGIDFPRKSTTFAHKKSRSVLCIEGRRRGGSLSFALGMRASIGGVPGAFQVVAVVVPIRALQLLNAHAEVARGRPQVGALLDAQVDEGIAPCGRPRAPEQITHDCTYSDRGNMGS